MNARPTRRVSPIPCAAMLPTALYMIWTILEYGGVQALPRHPPSACSAHMHLSRALLPISLHHFRLHLRASPYALLLGADAGHSCLVKAACTAPKACFLRRQKS